MDEPGTLYHVMSVKNTEHRIMAGDVTFATCSTQKAAIHTAMCLNLYFKETLQRIYTDAMDEIAMPRSAQEE